MKRQSTQPILVLIRGIPGSGKSYFAHSLYETLRNSSAILLDPDTTDYSSEAYQQHVQEQLKEGVDPNLHPYRYLRAQAYNGIVNNKVIIWNQPFSNVEILQKVITRLAEYAENNGKQLTIYIVEVAIDPEIAKERVKKRINNGGHGPSDNTFSRFVREYTTVAPLGYTVIPINGLDTPQKSVPIVLQHIAIAT